MADAGSGMLSKLLLMGLIALIPIVGWLQLLGWMLAALDNLRARHHYLPPAAFRYASRGVWLFVASLIYGVVALVLFYGVLGLMVVSIIGVSPPSTTTGNGSGTSAAAFGWRTVGLDDTETVWFGVSRGVTTEGRVAARAHRNFIRVSPMRTGGHLGFRRVVVAGAHIDGPAIHRVDLTRRDTLLVIPDEGERERHRSSLESGG